MGTLEPGKAASLVVRTGDPFSAESKVVDVFVDGVEYPVQEKKKPEGKGEGGGSRRPDEAGHAGREGGAR